MSATTFTQFPRELRDMIWSAATAVQYQQYCTAPCVERRRQAFVGYDNLPHDTERQPLRVYVHDSNNRDKMRLSMNECQTLVNCLPMATVCSEARSHAANFCRAQVKVMDLFYAIDALDELSDIRDEILEHVFVQPTTVMVTNAKRKVDGPVGFESAELLVDVVNRIFGSCVERIILNSWFDSIDTLEQIHWPHTIQTRKLMRIQIDDMDPIFIHDPSHDHSTMFMTPERALHVKEELLYEDEYEMRQLSWHRLKFYEILDASTKKLPRLQSIELELHTYCWDEVLLTRIKATNKDGVLWVNWSDVHFGFNHDSVEVD
ncbi:hypothetical protein K458DRAFT_381268 [Lentithecium fluviatile CBS 122367]|uniref:2EXR domain-containing protein n=1 Tax=Lentithecium fluviatile CBS 122367 TaxID=1168545 RepID=A0A6G1JMG3_9PLEO|nr:hypothetical protein K458DRAFT_381268 [Lentithecium fluviatile CBS 122367]